MPFPLLVSGVGVAATLAALWEAFGTGRPQGILALGIAGSYKPDILPGEAVWVQSERLADTGRRYRRKFIPTPPHLRGDFPLAWEGTSPPAWLPLPAVEGLTIQSVSGSPHEARFWQRNYPNAAIETQENAAFFLFAWRHRLPLVSVRIISNRVGSPKWYKDLALQNLHTFAQRYVAPLCEWILEGAASPSPK
uniref:Hypothetical conserved protein n=1 Tax=uncultured Bacteroidota bacterium TaxID=152509 RepID=H5SMS8_9BACT|nr:hypothetical conserved protein [uncultured Bacteroidetes bacterium]